MTTPDEDALLAALLELSPPAPPPLEALVCVELDDALVPPAPELLEDEDDDALEPLDALLVVAELDALERRGS